MSIYKKIIIGFILVLVFLVIACHGTFTYYNSLYSNRTIKPGDEYYVNDRKYIFPDLPLKVIMNNTFKKNTDMKSVTILKEDYLENMRKLFINTTKLLNDLGMEWWVSGGTLLGFIRHGTFIPWDDDIDIHTIWKNKDYLFSDDFAINCHKYGLEVFTIIGSSEKNASTTGAAIRTRLIGQYTPSLDIFFEMPILDNRIISSADSAERWSKIDKWDKKWIYLSEKETWNNTDLFPIKKIKTDYGLEVNIPNNAINILKQQYSDKVLDSMVYYSPYYSHVTLMHLGNTFGVIKQKVIKQKNVRL